MKNIVYILFLFLLLSGCNKESKREVAGDNVIDISELDDDQLGRCLGDSLFKDTTPDFVTQNLLIL